MPFVIQGVQSILKCQPGTLKKDKAMELFNLAAGFTEAIAQKDIVDETEFPPGRWT
jgi:hypothetical protein